MGSLAVTPGYEVVVIFFQEPWPSSGSEKCGGKSQSLSWLRDTVSAQCATQASASWEYTIVLHSKQAAQVMHHSPPLPGISLRHVPLSLHTQRENQFVQDVLLDSAFPRLAKKAASKEHTVLLNIWTIPWWCLLWIMAFKDLPGAPCFTLEENSYTRQRYSTRVWLMDGHALTRVKTLKWKPQSLETLNSRSNLSIVLNFLPTNSSKLWRRLQRLLQQHLFSHQNPIKQALLTCLPWVTRAHVPLKPNGVSC